jgi:hypothetical protein
VTNSYQAVILGTGFIAVPTGARQAAWNQASQDRVSATSTVLGSVKAIRVSGLTEIVFSSIRRLRRRELQISERFRWLLGVSLVLCMSSSLDPALIHVILVVANIQTSTFDSHHRPSSHVRHSRRSGSALGFNTYHLPNLHRILYHGAP